MAEISGFHNSRNGDRRVKADFFARFFGSLIGNGIFPNPSTGLQAMANGDMTVTVKAGKAWINGVFYENTADMTINLDVADGVLKRIDRVVLQYSTIDRTIAAKVKKGTFASSPVTPSLQRDADAYELGIADILVNNGVVSISQSNITDLRLNSNYCGVVAALINQVDTTTLFNQYQAWYLETTNQAAADLSTMLSAFQSSFNAWFADLQDILDENTAGNLLNKINDLIVLMTAAETAIGNHTADIAALETRLDNKEVQNNITLTAVGWTNTAPYTQTVLVTGLTAGRLPDKIIPQYSETLVTAVAQREAYSVISYYDTGTDQITFTCLEEKPGVDVPLLILGV